MKKVPAPISLAGSQLGEVRHAARFSTATKKSIAFYCPSLKKGSSVAIRRFTL